ncbi:COPB2 protein, partial [Pseudoatta argentina]
PLRLDIKRKLTARSDRVKSVDLHPTEPWMLCSLYQGHVNIWNHEIQTLVKTFEVCDLPVRTAKFVPRKNWVITGSDDMQIRIFNYNTLERVHSFEAHSDYVRCIAVHPTQPFILTSSDDMWIKLWNWEKSWICQQVFEGHTHYVMQIVFNPKDNNTFASASLDRTVKVWQLGSSTANFTLEGHEKGVNCVDYYHGGDKPYLISGADDRYVKIWDYQNKTCVQTLGGHTQNISAVCFHPELPIFLTASEDGTVRIWHAGMYRLESSLNYGFERVWTIACMRGSNNVAIGYDEGSVMVKVGREEPAVSMDSLGGKIVWARHSEIQQVNLKALGEEAQDGERLPLAVKDMGACEIYPQTIQHNPNGRFLVVCGDGEYIIYTSMALRNKAFGQASEFVWAADSSQYAVREGNTMVKVFKNFKEKKGFKPDFGADGIFGGFLLGVSSGSGLCFFDWDTLKLIRRIDIQPTHVYWAENASLVALATSDQYFILKYHADVVANATENSEDIENAFEMVAEMNEVVKTGLWVGDCFIYTNSVNRINYFVGGEVVTVSHLDRPMYLLGYVPRDNRLYLCDKELSVVSYSLLLSVLEYQTAVMRKDFETANRVLPTVPKEHRTRVAHFLEKQGFKEQALAVSTDPEHRFELALALGNLATAHTLAKEANSQQKWRQLASLATQKGKLCLAQECLHQAQDFGGLLLLATSTGNSDMIQKLGTVADDTGKNNISFLSNFILGDVDKCLDILIKTDRIPEAAFFARTYAPSKISAIIKLWKEKLSAVSEKAGQSLADPEQYENLFPGYREALKVEKFLREESKKKIPASAFPTITPNIERKPLEDMLAAEQSGAFQYKDSVNSISETEQKSTEAMIDRLQDLSISAIKDSLFLNKASTSIVKAEVPEKATTKPTSSSRPLTVDDDDLDIDLEIDDNIDTTVSVAYYIFVMFINTKLFYTYAYTYKRTVILTLSLFLLLFIRFVFKNMHSAIRNIL